MKALRLILFAVLMLPAERVWPAAMTTLTNFNAVYFLVDANPTAIPTNVVLLTGNLTNWQKLTTNIVGALTINPTDSYVPYRVNASTFGDSWWYYLANGMGIDTNLYFGPGITNFIYRDPGTSEIAIGHTGLSQYSVLELVSQDGMGGRVEGYMNGAYGGATLIGHDYATLSDSVRNVTLNIDGFRPNARATIPLGTLAVSWLQSCVDGTNYTIGFYGSSSDYARLETYHSGTNGSVHLDSQSGGSAGTARPIVFGIGATSNAFRLDSTMWDDSQVPEAMVRVGATAPTLANFNGGPVQTLQFQNNRDDTIMATVQMTHRWKQGTDIHPHVHWCETAATGAGTNVVWQLTYAWTNIGCAYPAYTTLKITNSVTGTNWFSQLSDFPDISGTNKLVSSIFVFELRRLANSATADDYNQNVAFLGFDIHHQVNSPGSDNELTKSF